MNQRGTFWFPGRWVGGVALIAGPVLLLSGVLLAAFAAHPTRMVGSYSLFLAGNMLLWPAVLFNAAWLWRTTSIAQPRSRRVPSQTGIASTSSGRSSSHA